MLCTNDHSLFEIMLGAEPYIPTESAWSMQMTMDDFGALMAADVAVKGGEEVFKREDVWRSVVADWLLGSSAGQAVFKTLGAAQQAYLKGLVSR